MRHLEKLNDTIAKAVAVLRRSQHLSDEQVYRNLVDEGIQRPVAAHLVEFLPIVYARLVLRQSGARFANSVRRLRPDGSLEERPLASEPLWTAAVAFAQSEVGRGIDADKLLAVAARSAEFHAANQLLNRGSNLRDIVFTPAVLIWPEGGPDPV